MSTELCYRLSQYYQTSQSTVSVYQYTVVVASLIIPTTSEHEENCDYTPVQCPNSSRCPVILKKVQYCIAHALHMTHLQACSTSHVLPHMCISHARPHSAAATQHMHNTLLLYCMHKHYSTHIQNKCTQRVNFVKYNMCACLYDRTYNNI